MTESVHVVAVLTAKPGMRPAYLEAFAKIVPEVHAEDGCLKYVVCTDTEGAGAAQTPYGEDVLVVVEEWESLAHLQAHGAAPHMKAFGEAVKDMVADRKIHILSAA
ncbi:putative quinol monooxygenase [Oceaniglobus roseus]|uniref:putative quinol monooxygenase n=1 Tax=Oceaniglobus roseus TaxID=1737570 RepID=UPI000C7EF78B|nr:putative quinol monooxygenase [Kandeliimicrobium roseum]